MAFIPAPHGALVKLHGLMFGQEIITTFQFRLEAEPVDTDFQALADAIDDYLGGGFVPTLGSQYQYVQTSAQGLSFEEDIIKFSNTNAGHGANVGTPLPNNSAFAIKRTSGLTGRSARGRIYVPGLIEEFCTDANHMGTLKADGWVAILNGLVDDANTAGWQHVVWSYQSGGAPRLTAFPFGIDEYQWVDLTLDSQRRRLPGRGL